MSLVSPLFGNTAIVERYSFEIIRKTLGISFLLILFYCLFSVFINRRDVRQTPSSNFLIRSRLLCKHHSSHRIVHPNRPRPKPLLPTTQKLLDKLLVLIRQCLPLLETLMVHVWFPPPVWDLPWYITNAMVQVQLELVLQWQEMQIFKLMQGHYLRCPRHSLWQVPPTVGVHA